MAFPSDDLLKYYITKQDFTIVEYLILTLEVDIEKVIQGETEETQLWVKKILLKKQLQQHLPEKKEVTLPKI